MHQGSVCVAIVTCNSARYIQRCLNAVLGGPEENLQVVVVDNASTDNTLQILKEFAGRIEIIANPCNRGFAEAQNQAIRATSSAWVLTLNPDVLLQPGFIPSLLEAAAADPRAGAVCGKLLSIGPGFDRLEIPASIPPAFTSRPHAPLRPRLA